MERQNHPDQKTCSDCSKIGNCTMDGIAHVLQRWCEWEPSRFTKTGMSRKQWNRVMNALNAEAAKPLW